jgi:transposase InsO family protein
MEKKKLDWTDAGELIAEIRRQGLTYKEGAERFGISVWKLYEYNRRQRHNGRRRRGASSPRGGATKAPVVERPAGPDVEQPSSVCAGEGGGTLASARQGGIVEASEPDAAVPAQAAPTTGEAVVAELEGSEEPTRRGRKEVALPGAVVDLIVGYRTDNPLHGFRRIEQWLRNKYLIVVSRKRIRAVLKEAGLLREGDSSFDRLPEDGKGTRRFEALYPRQLWQMDHTHVYIEGVSVLYLVIVEDDYSRYCVGASLERMSDGETMIGVLHNASVRYGKPEKLLTDEGPCFYSWSMGKTRFQQYLDEMEIEHIVADPHSPQTLGKTERLHQTVKNELLRKVRFRSFEEAREEIAKFIAGYNYERPHQGLGGARPADRFFGLIGEKDRVERELCDRELDFSRGYLILTTGGRTVSVVNSAESVEVYLDGQLLQGRDGHGHDNG